MSAYEAALELTDLTAWNDTSIAILLSSFIQEKGLTAEAANWLHSQAMDEAAEGGTIETADCDECGAPLTYKDIDGGRCLSCGTMICAEDDDE